MLQLALAGLGAREPRCSTCTRPDPAARLRDPPADGELRVPPGPLGRQAALAPRAAARRARRRAADLVFGRADKCPGAGARLRAAEDNLHGDRRGAPARPPVAPDDDDDDEQEEEGAAPAGPARLTPTLPVHASCSMLSCAVRSWLGGLPPPTQTHNHLTLQSKQTESGEPAQSSNLRAR